MCLKSYQNRYERNILEKGYLKDCLFYGFFKIFKNLRNRIPLPWGGRGRKFESCHSDHFRTLIPTTQKRTKH